MSEKLIHGALDDALNVHVESSGVAVNMWSGSPIHAPRGVIQGYYYQNLCMW